MSCSCHYYLTKHQISSSIFISAPTNKNSVQINVTCYTHVCIHKWKQLKLCSPICIHVRTYRWKTSKINTLIHDFSCFFIYVYRCIYKLMRVINTTRLVIMWPLWLWCANENPRFRFSFSLLSLSLSLKVLISFIKEISWE